jgi:hypothetical protein
MWFLLYKHVCRFGQPRFSQVFNIWIGCWSEARRKEIAAAKAEKFAHPVCSCATTLGKHWSTHCEVMEKIPDIDGSRGHTGCKRKGS